jgi:hypothetical protein
VPQYDPEDDHSATKAACYEMALGEMILVKVFCLKITLEEKGPI